MNRFIFILLCAATALAGWSGMAWLRGAHGAPAGKTARLSPAAGSAGPGDFARPAGKLPAVGSPGLSTLAAAIAQARALDPADHGTDSRPGSRTKLEALPPGAARDLALALFDLRVLAARGASAAGEPAYGERRNPFAELPPDAKLSPYGVAMEGTARRLLAGEPLEEFTDDALKAERDPFASSGGDMLTSLDAIKNWAALDPAAASETILKMPAGKSRTAAVDATAKVISRDNPQAAWDLVVKSGEQKPGNGAVAALLAAIGTEKLPPASLVANLPPLQKANLANRLVQYYLGRIDLGKPPGEEELKLVIKATQVLPDSPGRRELATQLVDLSYPAVLAAIDNNNPINPQSPEFLALQANGLLAMLDPGHPLGVNFLKELGTGRPLREDGPEVLNSAAPQLLPGMVKAGHLSEAVELYSRIPDPGVRRETLEKILPQWMEADPAAARAAFNAAPFTALERERWQRHPAFLLNPETGK